MKKKRYYDTLWNTMKSNIFCHKLENAAQILNPWYAMDTCTGYPENGKISFLLHSCTIVLVKPFRSRWTHGVPWYTYRFLVLEFGRSHIVTMCLQFTQLAYTLFSPPPTPPHTHTLIVIIHTLYLLMPLIPLPHRSPSYTMGISAAQIWCLCLHLWTVPPRMPTSVLALGSSSS